MYYEFSYPRSIKGHFRLTDDEDKIQLFKFISGHMRVVDNDNTNGRLIIETTVDIIDEDTAKFSYESSDMYEVPYGYEELEGLPYWRACFRRTKNDWRILNEHQLSTKFFTPKYKGVMNIDWPDRSSHIYHVGQVWISPTQDCALFIPGKETPNRPVHIERATLMAVETTNRAKVRAEAKEAVGV